MHNTRGTCLSRVNHGSPGYVLNELSEYRNKSEHLRFELALSTANILNIMEAPTLFGKVEEPSANFLLGMKATSCPRGSVQTTDCFRLGSRTTQRTNARMVLDFKEARKSPKIGCHAIEVILLIVRSPRIVEISCDPRPGVKGCCIRQVL